MKVSDLQMMVKDTLEHFGDLEVVFLGKDVNGKSHVVENPCCGILDRNMGNGAHLQFFVGFHHAVKREPTPGPGPGLKVVK